MDDTEAKVETEVETEGEPTAPLGDAEAPAADDAEDKAADDADDVPAEVAAAQAVVDQELAYARRYMAEHGLS